jgi:predicted DsbA family dithiol-disulfide isomerase
MTEVDFYFDVMCPWAYQTSLWIREAQLQRDIQLSWHFFSLEEVNREPDKKHPWERPWSYGWSMLRVAAMLRRNSQEEVGRFYAAAGAALHQDGRKVQDRAILETVLEEWGFDPAVVQASLTDATVDEEIRTDHQRALDLGGFGVPTLVLDGTTPLFGPVIAPAPTGDEAGRLWDLVAGWADYPNLYELRRPKTPEDFVHIQSVFSPYLVARDWRSVAHPVP